MNNEKLIELIVAGDLPVLTEELEALSDGQKKKLSVTAGEFATGLEDLGYAHLRKSKRALEARRQLEAAGFVEDDIEAATGAINYKCKIKSTSSGITMMHGALTYLKNLTH